MNQFSQKENFKLEFTILQVQNCSGNTHWAVPKLDTDKMPIGGQKSCYLSRILSYYSTLDLINDLISEIIWDMDDTFGINEYYHLDGESYMATCRNTLIFGNYFANPNIEG